MLVRCRDINVENLHSVVQSVVFEGLVLLHHTNVTEVVLPINFVGFCLIKIKSHWKPGTLAAIKRLWIAPDSF